MDLVDINKVTVADVLERLWWVVMCLMFKLPLTSMVETP
jgi:hypothetical protein